MIAVVYGGSASGKSAMAEQLACRLAGRTGDAAQAKEPVGGEDGELVYLATMADDGSPEAAARIEKHRRLREGKGFVTVECAGALSGLVLRPPRPAVLLLEDVSNLVANAMFADRGRAADVEPHGPDRAEGAADAEPHEPDRAAGAAELADDILSLAQRTRHLVIVTNNIFDGGIAATPALRDYADTLGAVNQRLAMVCDVFVEAVCGLPHVIKGALP